jgi:hypothetical protein
MLMCTWEGSAPGFVNIRDIKKSRRPHKCLECGVVIPPGSAYRTIAGVWEGDFDRMSQCQLCARIWEDLVDNGFCPDFGGLWEFIDEEFEEAEEEASQ